MIFAQSKVYLMKNVLLLLWQLPQNLIGFLLTRKSRATKDFICNDGEKITVYFTKNVFSCGVSLGNYIILDYDIYFNRNITTTVNHEHGHQKQSKFLGWFYLLVVGLTSAVANNLWDRLFHKDWTDYQRKIWYYNRFPENWADKLGNVAR